MSQSRPVPGREAGAAPKGAATGAGVRCRRLFHGPEVYGFFGKARTVLRYEQQQQQQEGQCV